MRVRNSIITIIFTMLLSCSIPVFSADGDYPPQRPANAAVQNDFSVYMQNLNNKLRTNWQPPDFMEEGHVRVYFKLNRQGNVLYASVIESSGNDIYDESALEAIKDSAPFGEFPEDTLREFIAVKYTFDTILIEEERMNGYYELAKMYARSNPQKALEYLNLALDKVGGEEASCFLYKRRAEIKDMLGDKEGALADYSTYDLYITRANIKRVHLLKHLAENKQSVFLYHYLAYAYEQVQDYDNAIIAINKAISLTDENATLKRYRDTLMQKQLNN